MSGFNTTRSDPLLLGCALLTVLAAVAAVIGLVHLFRSHP